VIEKISAWVEKGIITVRVVTLTVLVIVVVMWAKGITLPLSLDFTWKLILGYWFGTEGMKAAFEMAKEAWEKEHEAHLRHHKVKGEL